ncbi:hypothetical protein HDV05_003891 [Chytridiales sp. JEL 0842]|nr:hypothetical protein HDV05_003891 [Chytridiales sp. JEL 0842]
MAAPLDAAQASLFQDLDDAIVADDHERIVKLCDKLLVSMPNDEDVVNTKVVALIKLDKFEDALGTITKAPKPLKDQLLYEQAYCFYKQHKHEECLKVIDDARQSKSGFTSSAAWDHLEMQVEYNAETFDKYEAIYNTAYALIGERNWTQAEELLLIAKQRCQQALLEGDEEVQAEMAIIIAQLAYVLQMQGRIDEASALYQNVLELRPSDEVVKTVVTNNIVALRISSKDAFETANMFRTNVIVKPEIKLSTKQKQTIACNSSLVSLMLKKHSAAREEAKKAHNAYGAFEMAAVITASIDVLEGKTERALKALKVGSSHKKKVACEKMPNSLIVHLALAQLEASRLNWDGAASVLLRFFNEAPSTVKFSPGLVSICVWMQKQKRDLKGASDVLNEASCFWNSQSINDSRLFYGLAELKVSLNLAELAAADYERLVKLDPSSLDAIAGLIVAYAEFDLNSAERYAQYLPALNDMYNGAIPDSTVLEASGTAVFNAKKAAKDPSEVFGAVTKMEKKKKQKIRKPKLHRIEKAKLGGLVDPERWLPRRERTTAMKKKGDVLKGPQGTSVAGGGIGGTGSAKIHGRTVKIEETVIVEEKKPENENSTNKKKKKGRK